MNNNHNNIYLVCVIYYRGFIIIITWVVVVVLFYYVLYNYCHKHSQTQNKSSPIILMQGYWTNGMQLSCMH